MQSGFVVDSTAEFRLKDLPNSEACLAALPQLMERLEARIQRAGEISNIHHLFVKLKFNDFQQTTVEQVHDKIDLNIFCQLIHEGYSRKCLPVRLLGVGIKLKQEKVHEMRQLPLFGL